MRGRVSIFEPDSEQYLRRGSNETITARSKLEALFRGGWCWKHDRGVEGYVLAYSTTSEYTIREREQQLIGQHLVYGGCVAAREDKQTRSLIFISDSIAPRPCRRYLRARPRWQRGFGVETRTPPRRGAKLSSKFI